jgi:peroxiredoxin
MDQANDIPTKRRIDGVTAIMIVVTAAALLGAAWLRTRRQPENQPPAAGALAPPLGLLDLETSEPVVLVGLRGKVVWVVFWSADSSSSRSNLIAINDAWKSLRARERFAMVAAAVEADHPERVRAAVAESGVKLPIYLASAESRRRFGALEADPPLNLLIDADGHIATLARGTSPQTLERIADQAGRMLDELGAPNDSRFASALGASTASRLSRPTSWRPF